MAQNTFPLLKNDIEDVSSTSGEAVSFCVLCLLRGGPMLGEASRQRWNKRNTTIHSSSWKTNTKHWLYHLYRHPKLTAVWCLPDTKVNSASDCTLCISFCRPCPPVYVRLWPVPAPNFHHHIQSRPANGQLHYSQYLKSPLVCFQPVCSSVSSESRSFKCSCADCWVQVVIH